MPLIYNLNTKRQLYLHQQAVDAGWKTERKVQATFVTNSLDFRYHCDIVEGKAKKPCPKLALQLESALQAFHATHWYPAARKHAKKIDAITQRAMALGHIQDLTDPETSTQWVRIYVLAYTIGFAVGKVMPGLDLTRSNLNELSAVYYAPGYELNIKGFQDSYELICDLWGGPVIIETYPGLPQAVWIRPVQVEQVETHFSADFEAMPTLDELSLGTSLLNAKQHITFSFKGKENLENMLIVGMTRSGKSTWVQNLLISLRRMRQQVEGISYLDGSFSPGLGILRSIGIRVADDKESVQTEVHNIQKLADWRDNIMKKKGWIKWPIGETLEDGSTTGIYVVVIDENQKFFAKFPPNSPEGGIVKLWPTELLKRGIMMVSVTPAFTEKEGPVIYWAAFEWKVMFHIEEQVAVQRMFHKDRGNFKFHPLELQRGQFVMKLPGALNLVYGMGHPPMILKLTNVQQEGSNDG